ncbi:ADP ribosylation factor like GTPase 3, like 1 isoform X2 [Oreochromis aureus]|uniref:ADP ribosylation factor like GTPase 3, like 1 isoform X2 n=1 Tax=Oreochromis aureus TaxID=47969 RepID=UPI0019540417|nr:ADP ribosylation factor like GTPase 3, like 1 isoform X2 [Oreochromis aureus]
MVIIYLMLGYLLTDTSVLCENGTLCNGTTIQQCTEVSISSEPSSPSEGDDVTLTCNEKCENSTVTYQWKENGGKIEGENNKTLLIKIVHSPAGEYVCSVNCSCYCCDSKPYTLSVKENTVIILVICGVAALALVLIMGLIMKCKLKIDNDKHRERVRQRQAGQAAGGPYPITPRGS